MNEAVNYLITIRDPADIPHVAAMLADMPVASRWVAVSTPTHDMRGNGK